MGQLIKGTKYHNRVVSIFSIRCSLGEVIVIDEEEKEEEAEEEAEEEEEKRQNQRGMQESRPITT